MSKYSETTANKIIVGGRRPATRVRPAPAPVTVFPSAELSSVDVAAAGTLGISPLEQLMLRGDGLTTTSLEILTGRRITVRVRRQQRLPLTVPGQRGHAADARGGDSGSLFHEDPWFHAAATRAHRDTYADIGLRDLEGSPGDDLLVREVLLTGDNGVVHGAASVLAIVDRLPVDVVRALDTEEPIGRLLTRAALPIVRELRSWGRLPAGGIATCLGPGLSAQSQVPARTYRMRDMRTGRPLTLITEWFSPRLFGLDPS
ncbi:chorismate pyruvate-lyase family protein [Frankia sp. CiP1_Cm_nod2]|uniref:chorismate pyruvate-lyase family protein n=1 Tax=Frankia sp. CiP1_Cm_nod2 TaxID=2897161 RepID=UPI0020240CCE